MRHKDTPEIVACHRRETFPVFFAGKAPQPLIDLRRGERRNRFTVEDGCELGEAAAQILDVTLTRAVRFFDLQEFINQFCGCAGAVSRFQMREIKVDRVANGRVKGFELFRAFQVLGALPFVERESGPVVLLLNELLLEQGFRFRLVFEELPVDGLCRFSARSRTITVARSRPLLC